MPDTQPGQPVPLQKASPEQLIAEWQEPNEKLEELARLPLSVVIIGALILAALLIAIGVWQHDFTYYLAAAVSVSAGAAIVSQRRKPAQPRDIALTTQRLQVGRKSHLLPDLAGFWLESIGEVTAINVEPKKAAMLPITFLYPSISQEEARTTMLEVLPELEPRRKTAADSIGRYIRL